MTHEKLVAGTTSPTRYTKIIRFPGEGTKYNRTYQETDYVSRYTKTVAGGTSYIPPAPPTPPTEPLEVAPGQGSNWVGSNKYEIGQTVEARTAIYTGGVEPCTYRYRFQSREMGSEGFGEWINEPWTDTTNKKNSVYFPITFAGQIKMQSQARDSSDPSLQLNSVTGTKDTTGIGDLTATVDGSPYDLVHSPALTVLTQDPIAVVVEKSGYASVTYNWTVRSPAAAEFSNQIGASTDVTIATAGVATVQCRIQSLGQAKTITIQFFGVATKEELNELTN